MIKQEYKVSEVEIWVGGKKIEFSGSDDAVTVKFQPKHSDDRWLHSADVVEPTSSQVAEYYTGEYPYIACEIYNWFLWLNGDLSNDTVSHHGDYVDPCGAYSYMHNTISAFYDTTTFERLENV